MTLATSQTTATGVPDADLLRQEFLRFYGRDFAGSELAREMRAAPRQSVFPEIAKLELMRLGETAARLDEEAIRASCGFVRERFDCADFTLAALLRVLYRYGDGTALSPALRQEIEETVLTFTYSIDDASRSTAMTTCALSRRRRARPAALAPTRSGPIRT